MMQMVIIAAFADEILGTRSGDLGDVTDNIVIIILPYVVYSIFLRKISFHFWHSHQLLQLYYIIQPSNLVSHTFESSIAADTH